MELGILGPLVVSEGGRAVEVPGTRPRALLALLALHPGQVLSAERLVDELWGGVPPAHAANALQAAVSRLRRALEPGRPATEPSRLVAGRSGGYALQLEPEAVDAVRFERLAAHGRRTLTAGDPGQASRLLRRALDLWRGTALADFSAEAFAEGPRARLEELRLAALEDRVQTDLGLAEHGPLVGELQSLIREHPLRERLRGQLMLALYRTGRQADALALYDATRRVLAERLGLDPSPELQRLQRAMLAQDPTLEAPLPPRQGPLPTASTPRAASAPAAAGRGRGRPFGNLPARLDSFVGRLDDIAQVRELLQRGRLVTLTGPGGVGKSRLAGEAAVELAGQMPDGVWLVELAPLHDPGAVAQAVLSALEVRESGQLGGPVALPPRGARARLLEVLAGKRLLLILDNCEHLVESAADLAETVLAACPEVRVLSTSREALRVPGERLYEVPPLGVPRAAEAPPTELLRHAAVRLLVERANAIKPSFWVTPENAAAVVEVCRRLDGMPLAIELAAARLRALPIEQVAARLDDRFQLLTSGSRTAVPRQRTLRAVMEWSWELLVEPEQAVLRRLAVFAGGCTLEAAEVVCAGAGVAKGDVLDLLDSLIDKSLLEADEIGGGQARYRLLETVRAYAAERLAEAGEAQLARDAHAAWFTEFAQAAASELRGRRQLEWIERLETEHENLRAALRWALKAGEARTALRLAIALAFFWWLRGYREEGPRWLEAALDLAGREPTLERAEALAWSGFAWGQDVTATRARMEEALAVYRQLGDTRGAALPMVVLTGLERIEGNHARSARLLKEALEAQRDDADPWMLAMLLLYRSGMRLFDGELAAAEEDVRRADERFLALGERWGRCSTLQMLAILAEIGGAPRRAAALLEEALALALELGNREIAPDLLTRIGGVLQLDGDLEGARRRLEEALELAERLGLASSVSLAHQGLSMLARAAGRPEEARAHAELAAVPYARPELAATIAYTLCAYGFIAEVAGHAGRARHLHLDGLAAAARTADPRAVSMALEGLARTAVLDGGDERAATLLGAAEGLRAGGAPVALFGHREHDRLAAAARSRLGAARFDQARERGAALSLDQAVTYAGE